MQENDVLELDLRHYIGVLWKWRWVVVCLTTLSVLTAGALSWFVLPPVYETKLTLMVRHAISAQQLGRIDSPSVVETLSRLPQMTMNSYVGQLTSPYFLDRVITTAKLDRSVYTSNSLARMINVTAVRDTNLIEVKIQHTDAVLAADIANAVGREFLVFLAEKNEETMSKAVSFLQTQLDLINQEIEESRQAMAQVQRGSNGLTILTSLTEQRKSMERQFSSELLRAEMDVEVLKATIGDLETKLLATPPVLEERSETTTTRVTPGETAGEEAEEGNQQEETITEVIVREVPNPVYLSIEQSLQAKRTALLEKEAQVRILARRLAETRAELEYAEAELQRRQNEEQRLNKELAQLEKSQTQIYDKLLESQIARSADLGEASISVVSPAMVPRVPVKPRKLLNVAIAGVLAGMLSLGLVFVLEYMDNTVKRPEDVAQALGLPALGSIPVIKA